MRNAMLLSSTLEESHRPDLYSHISPPGGNTLAIGRPGDCIYRVCVSPVGVDGTSGGSLPDLHSHIKTGRGNIVATGRPGDRADAAGVPSIDDDLAPGGC